LIFKGEACDLQKASFELLGAAFNLQNAGFDLSEQILTRKTLNESVQSVSSLAGRKFVYRVGQICNWIANLSGFW
jgi:hypothetical protein